MHVSGKFQRKLVKQYQTGIIARIAVKIASSVAKTLAVYEDTGIVEYIEMTPSKLNSIHLLLFDTNKSYA